MRNDAGVCVPKSDGKQARCLTCEAKKNGYAVEGNPINGGTGDKSQTEPIYADQGASPLNYQLSYTSRQPSSQFKPAYAHGQYWIGNYGFRLYPDGGTAPPAVSVLRPDGQLLGYRLSAGNYVSDADVSHKLVRQADAASATTGWLLWESEGGSVEAYDATGKLLSITDRQGNVQTLAYDGAGLLASVTNSFGRQLHFAYDVQNRIVALTPPDGGSITFAYDAANNLAGVTWPDGKARAYLYEDSRFPNNLTGITDENNARYATWTYDALGRAVSSQHAASADQVTLAYSSGSTAVTDALGTVRTTTLATILNVVKGTGASQPGGSGCGPSSSAITYDANSNVASRTDFNGIQTTYAYDLARNLETSRIEAAGKPEARTISTQWHGYWRLPVKVAEPKKLSTYVYNGDIDNGNVLTCAPAGALVPLITGGSIPIGVLCRKTEQATTDANGSQGLGATVTGTPRTWTYTYNAYGQVLTADGPRTDTSDVTASTYYDAADPDFGKRGKLASITDALGHTTQISAYDANGRPLTLLDPNGLVTTLAYDARGRLTSRSVGTEVTSYQYDGVGQPVHITLPDNAYLDYTYDAAHRLTGIADGLGNKINYTLDAMGNRVREDVLDPANQLAQTRSRVYDALNRLFKVIGAQNQTTTYAYDANGNLTGITDPLAQVTTNAYDALNRLKQVTDPGIGVTKYGYDGRDQLTQVTDPRNLVTGYTVDGLGNLTLQASPDTGTSASTFDAAGNLLTRTDAKGQVTSYVYDALNRVTSISFQDGSTQAYAYDQGANGIGRLTQITETNAASQVTNQVAYTYDQNGRVLTETRTVAGVAYVNAYSYDAAGRMTAMTYPSGRTVAYSYDALGRIAGMTTTKDGNATTLVSNVAYQPFGGVKSFSYGNGQTYTRQYDQDGRIAAYSLGAKQYTLGYDAASRIGAIAEYGNAANINSYGYDALDRLTQATLPSTGFGYSYDPVGNRMTKSAGAGTDLYAYGATSNRLSGITPASGAPRSFQFDANGSTTNDGVRQYAYDPRGRLIQATTAQGTASYQLNALGQRVQKSAPGASGPVATVFHYDVRGRLIAESDASGTVKQEYVYLNDLPVAVLK